jgi:hypothetical protein
MKILFLQGHNTQDTKVYEKFIEFFGKKEVTYFDYGLYDSTEDIYKSICESIQNNKFDCLIAHSMGGYFASRYIEEHGATNFTKVIFMMPLLFKVPSIDLLSKIPLIGNLIVPKGLIYPASSLSKDKGILSDPNLLKPIPLKQIVQIYKQLKSDSETVTLLNRNDNCVVIYANNELFTTISDKTLSLIKRKRIIAGEHEAFSTKLHQEEFFRVLKQELHSD